MTGAQLVRYIDEKRFYRHSAHSTKTEAKNVAKRVRKGGDNARIFHNKYEGWVVYWSEMTWVHKKRGGKKK